MNNKMNIPLSGIIPPLVTPLLDDDAYILFCLGDGRRDRKSVV